jgi:hypothetical protein
MLGDNYLNNSIKLIGLTLLAANIWIGTAEAQVSVSPMVIEAEANRNLAQGLISVTNITTKPFRARVYAKPFTYNRDAGFQALSSSLTDLTPYLQFAPNELVVPPGATRRIRLISQLPPNLPDGEYRVIVFTENLEETKTIDKNGYGVNIRTKIGSAFYVRKGKLAPNLVANSANFDQKNNLVQLLVSNKGKASVLPVATWVLKRDGKEIATGETRPTGIDAEGDRYFTLSLDNADKKLKLQPGSYELSGNLSWGSEPNKSSVPFKLNLAVPI